MKAIKTLVLLSVVCVGTLIAGCSRGGRPDNAPLPDDDADGMPMGNRIRKVRPGITVLLDDSIKLIAGKRVALVTNQTGVDEKGRRSIDLLATDPRALRAGVKLVRLFAPEHGATGTADRPNLSDEKDARTGLTIHALYQSRTIAPPDSLLTDVDVLVVDLQDIGTRTWTYVGVMLYSMQAGAKRGIPVLVLDRPNPISGARAEGALLDSALANADMPAPGSRTNGFALYPMPLRHGLTMGEMARLFQAQLKLGTRLTVVPMRNWRRGMWFDETSLPWVRPSPNMPNITSALLYPALVPFESSNVSVGRGTDEPFQRFGAAWLRADSVTRILEDLSLTGVKFKSERFTPNKPGDGKFAGQSIPGVRIEVTDRERVQPARVGAAILWALSRVHKDSLKVTAAGFDQRMGSTRAREALLGGADPDAVMDRQLPAVIAFEKDARRFYLYR
ncbi:exo-beta-N-acetylmuramidase NamZ domain-containing protein [Gemmatimonas sp.]|uniref:exo-beta-N-acetylmuramidase NamZ family protein n=1 Tax=Gemmatimonas sp. TaxID=1962908 RepID=UPI00356391E5